MNDVEKLFLSEMIEEDANYLIMGDHDEDIEAVVPQTLKTGLFDNTSSEDALDEEDDDNDIF